MQPEDEDEDPSSLLFVVVADDREYPYHGPFMRDVSFLFLPPRRKSLTNLMPHPLQSDLRCRDCSTIFESWVDLQTHRNDAHGVEFKNVLPDDL
jgi:hypothetical protein